MKAEQLKCYALVVLSTFLLSNVLELLYYRFFKKKKIEAVLFSIWSTTVIVTEYSGIS